jgi:hypothetical protein
MLDFDSFNALRKDDRNSVCAFHTGEGGPYPPTGKSMTADYVYVTDFEGDKIRTLTKIWNAGWAIKELGWGLTRSSRHSA